MKKYYTLLMLVSLLSISACHLLDPRTSTPQELCSSYKRQLLYVQNNNNVEASFNTGLQRDELQAQYDMHDCDRVLGLE